MTRIAGYSYRGTHVALPEKPSRLSDCYFTNGLADAGTIALAVSSITWLRGRGFVNPAIRRAAVLSLVTVPFYFVRPRVVKRVIEQRGEKVEQKKTPLVQKVGRSLDWDDFAIGGIIIGLAAAANPNFPTTIRTYQKFLGLASLGCSTATSIADVYTPIRKQAKEFADGPQRQSLAWLAKKPITFNFPGGAIEASGDFKLRGGKSADTLGTAKPLSPGMTEAEESVQQQAQPRSIQRPHLAMDDVDGSTVFIPKTDYTWCPSSQEEGLAILRQHIQELTEKRDLARLAANYLWMTLSARELEFYLSRDPEKHNELRNSLQMLNDLHVACFSDMANLSWMIADSQKNIKQMEEGGLAHQDMSNEAKRQTLSKVHQGIVAGMCKDSSARMDTVSAGMRWMNQHVRKIENLYQGLAKQYIELLKQSPEALNHDLDSKEFRDGLSREVKELMDKQDVGKALVHLKKFAKESSEELGKLRDEHWNEKKE